jgi:CheY-like chemotaxis protein
MTKEKKQTRKAAESGAGKTTGQAAASIHALRPPNRRRILIVDDETNIREIFRQVLLLGLPGCRFDVAVNGAEAVESFRQAHQGVILMDLRMPLMDGERAFCEIEKICVSERWEMPSVVFCTGYDPPNGVKEIVAGDPRHGLLQKPVTNEILLETLRSKVEKSWCPED